MKKVVLSVLGLILVCTLLSSAKKESNVTLKKCTLQTYYYLGGPYDDPNSYGAEPASGCEGSDLPCQIVAPMDPYTLDIDLYASVPGTFQTVLERIQSADDNNQTNETVLSMKF